MACSINDLELDNLTWTANGISVLDFDEYGHGWYLLDIAKALTDLLGEDDTIDSLRITAFAAGYRQHHTLDDEMLGLLPDFLALSELRGYMSLVRAIDIEEQDGEVEWMRNMIRRLTTRMREYERSVDRKEGLMPGQDLAAGCTRKIAIDRD